MYYIEIQTIEGKRLEWVAIYADSRSHHALEWGHALIRGLNPAPALRVTEGHLGPVIGAWQETGYTEKDS